MNKKIILILILIGGLKAVAFPGPLAHMDFGIYEASAIVRSGDALENSIVNILDGDDNTRVLLNPKGRLKEFKVVFKQAQKVDRLILVSGRGYGRIKGLRIRVIEGAVTNKVYDTELNDQSGPQWINPGVVQGEVFSFEILSWYTHPDSTLLSLAELRFQYGNQAIDPGTAEELKEEYRKSYRDYVKDLYTGLLTRTARVEWEDLESTLSQWQRLGIPIGRIYREYKKDQVGLLMEISSESEYRGLIIVGIDAGKMYMKKKGDFDFENKLADKMTIGEWYIDGIGHLWVKIGNGGWKNGGELYFNQTDLGEVSAIGAP